MYWLGDENKSTLFVYRSEVESFQTLQGVVYYKMVNHEKLIQQGLLVEEISEEFKAEFPDYCPANLTFPEGTTMYCFNCMHRLATDKLEIPGLGQAHVCLVCKDKVRKERVLEESTDAFHKELEQEAELNQQYNGPL